jgi:hypothetical protein
LAEVGSLNRYTSACDQLSQRTPADSGCRYEKAGFADGHAFRSDPMSVFAAQRYPAAAFLFVITIVYAPFAMAHKTSYAYLNAIITNDRLSGKLELAIRDFDFAFFDYAFSGGADHGAKVNLTQLRRHEREIADLLLGKISIGSPGAPCELNPGKIELNNHGGEDYISVPFFGECDSLGVRLQVGYDLMFEIDPQHRGLVDVRRERETYSGVMTPQARTLEFSIGQKDLRETVVALIHQGVHHIWTGYDHILFLVSLLLPSVLNRKNGKWLPVDELGGAFWSVFSVVTAFTLAHSITLSAAVFGIFDFPSRFVDPLSLCRWQLPPSTISFRL